MKIAILCTDKNHPVNPWLREWQSMNMDQHEIVIRRDKHELSGGDILFLISCSQIVNAAIRGKYQYTLVLHASDLPKGRGWSPHVWSLLEGASAVTVSLLEAGDSVDTGHIWAKRSFPVPVDALHDEIHRLLFETEVALMDEGLGLIVSGASPVPQRTDIRSTYFRKRTPADSEIDPTRPLAELFSKIRIADPERYPAFFRLHGHTYTIELKKVGNDEHNHDR